MQVRSGRQCDNFKCVVLPTSLPAGLTLRSADDADWPAMTRLAATCFGVFRPTEVNDMWRTMTPAGGAVVVCDGPDIVGKSLYLYIKQTVPGGAVLSAG